MEGPAWEPPTCSCQIFGIIISLHSCVLQGPTTYLEGISWHEAARVLEPHRFCDRCHVEQVYRSAEVANRKVPGIGRELHSPDPRTECEISILQGGIRRTQP